jgi:hypothetical protein
MHPNALMSDQMAVMDAINPVSQAAGTITTAWVSAANFERFLATIITGVLGAAATVDAKFQQAQDNAGTGAKDVANKAVTQIVKATGDNKSAMINLRDEELDVANGFSWIRVSLTVGVAASLVGVLLQGGVARFAPPKDALANPAINLGSANVLQIVP